MISEPNSKQNELFEIHSNFLRKNGIRVPKVEAFDHLKGFMILEDFGDKVVQLEINEENKDEILIYPQPIEEKGTFKFKNPNNYKSELLIFSSYGQTIQKLQTTNDQFQIRNKLNGIYFYKLSINDQFKSSGKIIFID